uniref:Uncharacterized protein n=1 Tax=Timema douglasi TaxID=61478 RepID=A0A7R8VHG2_TIMDO|nr:unnamed protein product [Timema douglasi]
MMIGEEKTETMAEDKPIRMSFLHYFFKLSDPCVRRLKRGKLLKESRHCESNIALSTWQSCLPPHTPAMRSCAQQSNTTSLEL